MVEVTTIKYEKEANKIIETVLSRLYKTDKWKELSIGRDVVKEVSGMIEDIVSDECTDCESLKDDSDSELAYDKNDLD